MQLKEHEPLAHKTTFRIGGPARYFVDVASREDLAEAFDFARNTSLQTFVMGGGSNLLVADDGFDGLVLRIRFSEGGRDGSHMVFSAGCQLWESVRELCAANMGGLEKLAGIPGDIGGAIRGNAGAFGTEIGDRVVWVECIDERGMMRRFSREECDFGYRSSLFKRESGLTVWRVALSLDESDQEQAMVIMDTTIAERNRRHLQNVRAAGSFFINPLASHEIQKQFEEEKGIASRSGRVPAGWLIEKAGMRGYEHHGAEASTHQANYLVNHGTARASDVLFVANEIRRKVYDRFAIELQPEAQLVNCALERIN